MGVASTTASRVVNAVAAAADIASIVSCHRVNVFPRALFLFLQSVIDCRYLLLAERSTIESRC